MKLRKPFLIFPLKAMKTRATRIKYGTIARYRIPEFNPFPNSPPLFSATALQFAQSAKRCCCEKTNESNIIDFLSTVFNCNMAIT